MNSFTRHAPTAATTANRDVREYVFGFGRRSCPGRELADASLFMYAAMTVAVLDLKQVPGKEAKREWVAGTITCVLFPFFSPFLPLFFIGTN